MFYTIKFLENSVKSRCLFYLIVFSESQKKFLQDVESRFYNVIIFLAIIM